MSTERKEKVAKKNAEKQERVITPIDNHRIENKIDDNGIATAQLQKATGAPSLENRSIEVEDALAAIKGPRAAELGMSIDENGGVKYPEYQTNAGYAIRDIQQKMPTGATQKKATGAPKVVRPAEPKPLTFSDYLAKQRENLKQDKTDAEKMQKYYALTDVFNALGKMGGAAVGGAIGGNMLDSAPAVGEYQQSRGYLDAFERAKQANDRLRALDEQEFGLAYNKQQRDEERAYNEKIRAEERKYKAELMRLESELRQAEKAGDREAEEKFRLKVLELTQAHEEKLKSMSVGMVNTQMGGGNRQSQTQEDFIPFTFQNLTTANIPKNLYSELLSWASSLGEVGDEFVDAENAETFLRQNPELVNRFLNLYGYGTKPETTSVTSNGSDAPVVSSKPSNGDIELVKNISIMHDSPTLARNMDLRNQKIAQEQAVKNKRVQELMDKGYTEQEAKRQVRVENRIAKATAKYGVNPTILSSAAQENVDNKTEYSIENDPFASRRTK